MEVCGFSENANRLAVGEVDGRIKFVDCGTSEILQEFTPSGHLSAACCCIAWQAADRSDKHATTLRKSNSANRLVALGCVNGTIIIYDSVKSEVVGRLEGGHTDRVTCVRWHPSRRHTLYSGGQDGHIVEWNTSKCALRNRWKADRHAVFAIELFETLKTENGNGVGLDESATENGLTSTGHSVLWLVSASRTIKVWNVLTQECVAVLSAHTTEVHFLRIAEPLKASNTSDFFIVSASKQERIGCVWRLESTKLAELSATSKKKQKTQQPIAYLKADSDTRSLACVRLADTVVVSVGTQTGELLIYELAYDDSIDNLRQREPLKTVRFCAIRNSKAPSTQFSIVGCTLTATSESVIRNGLQLGFALTIAYRTKFVYAVETLNYSDLVTGANLLEREERVSSTSVGSASLRIVTADATVTQALSSAAARKIREPLVGNTTRFLSEAETERFQLDAGALSAAMTPPVSTPSSSASESIEPTETASATNIATTEPTLGDRLRQRKRKAAENSHSEAVAMETDDTELVTKKSKAEGKDSFSNSNDVSAGDTSIVTPVGGDSVLTVLIQGLQSGDEKLLDSVFRPVRNISTIRRTIEQLPPTHLNALVRELLRRVQDSSQKMDLTMRWIRATISTHAAQFALQPSAMRALCSIRQLFEVRMRTFSELLSLNGKLELALDQVERQCSSKGADSSSQGKRSTATSTQQQLIVYRDYDSDSDAENCEDEDSANEDTDDSDLASQELFDEDELEGLAQQKSSGEDSEGDDDDEEDDDDGSSDNQESDEDS